MQRERILINKTAWYYISAFWHKTALFHRLQWLKCHRTQGNAVPPSPIFSPRRSLTSNFQKTQGTLRGMLRYASNRISAHCALNFCTVLPFLQLRIHVEDVNVNAWLPDNGVNLVVSGPTTNNRGTRVQNPSITGPQPPTRDQNLKLQSLPPPLDFHFNHWSAYNMFSISANCK